MDSNQTIPLSERTGISSHETLFLDAMIPGYSLVSRFLLSYLKIDLAAYLQQLILLVMIGAATKYAVSYISDFVKEYLVSTAEIRLDDETFNYFMYWISRQPHMKRTNRFVAGVKSNGYCSEGESEDDDNNLDQDNGEWDEPGSADGVSWDEYWAKVMSRDKYKPLRFTPSQGRHIFWYKRRPLMLERRHQTSSHRYVLNNERLYLSCLGRDASILRTVLNEAQQAYVQRDGNRTIIYRGTNRYYSRGSWDWARCMARSPRPLSTVVLDPRQKEEFIDDIKEYLHPRTRRWYSNRGIPYRRGYLLHGPPGTGKTSLCFAAAGLFGLKLYLLNLNSKSLDEESLASLFSELPNRCIVLLEDVDTAGITKTRGKTIADIDFKESEGDADLEEVPAEDVDAIVVEEAASTDKADGITLSGLLNVIDGVAASEGRILVMTSNHPEKLDAALLRPGRVDMRVAFGYASKMAIEELFSSIYMAMDGDSPRTSAAQRTKNRNSKLTNGVSTPNGHTRSKSLELLEKEEKEKEEHRNYLTELRSRITTLAKEFASIVPADEFTAAEIQGYLLNYKNTPEVAIKGAGDWANTLREKKKRREEKRV
ncbi:ATPaseAAA-typecore [Penicillium lividum]|nr:ATPaseAAA-typecore [Penicillium lividum]